MGGDLNEEKVRVYNLSSDPGYCSCSLLLLLLQVPEMLLLLLLLLLLLVAS